MVLGLRALGLGFRAQGFGLSGVRSFCYRARKPSVP